MNRHGVLRKAVTVAGIGVGCFLALAVAFSLWYLIKFYPRTAESFEINSPDQPTRILVATQGSEFKDALVAAVCDRLRKQPVHVKVIDVGGLGEVDTDEWNKVLVVNTAMMNIMSGPVRRLVARGEGLDKVLLFVTSGGADFKPADLTVDALSGASRKRDTNRLADLILDWTTGAGQGCWPAAIGREQSPTTASLLSSTPAARQGGKSLPSWISDSLHISPTIYCGRKSAAICGVCSHRGARRTASTRSAPLRSQTPHLTTASRPRDES